MSLRRPISTFTGVCSEQIERLKQEIETADAIAIGAGAGMSTSCLLYTSALYFSNKRKRYAICYFFTNSKLGIIHL